MMADEQWILSAIPPTNFDVLPHLKSVKEDYNVLFWDDFEREPESFYDKIKVILFSPPNSKKLTEVFLRKMCNLKVVSTFSTGISSLDIPLLRKFNIEISRVPGTVTAETTADHGFMLMMMAGRRILENVVAAKGSSGSDFVHMDPHAMLFGQDIHHATLGIVGMGMIGFEVARRAKGFQMKVLYHNRQRREDDEEVGATYCSSLASLLPQVDYLMLTPPLTDDTRGMMGREQFKLMRPTAIVINVSRGPVVVTEDLVEALKNGTIGGAALDVTDPEPLPHTHPLLDMPNVIVTPHVAMLTRSGISRMAAMVASNLRAAMDGTQMPGELTDPKHDGAPKL